MNLNQLAKEICKREGKKKQVDIAQVKEILKVIQEIITENLEIDEDEGTHSYKEDSLIESFMDDCIKKKTKMDKLKLKETRKVWNKIKQSLNKATKKK